MAVRFRTFKNRNDDSRLEFEVSNGNVPGSFNGDLGGQHAERVVDAVQQVAAGATSEVATNEGSL